MSKTLECNSMSTEALLKLARFGWDCLQEHRAEMTDIDGGTAQDLAIKHGVIVSRAVDESCGDHCECFDFPTECYFIAADILAVGSQLEPEL